jgi:multidrug efflux system membrane fusion protein
MTDGRIQGGLGGSMQSAKRRPRAVIISVVVLLLAIFIVYEFMQKRTPPPAAPQVIRVEAAAAKRQDVPVLVDGLGTVQALYTVTISPRVDGELTALGFVEGQMVKRGDLLAQIDPRPYQAALDQAVAAKAKDVAQLANARRDLERYVTLAPEEFTSKQTLDTQRALVDQLVAQIASDQAAIDGAKTQLDYATIRSPIQGRTGIRLTDPGNIVHAATATGIVVVTQVQPISVVFTLPAEDLQPVKKAMAAGPVAVTAISRDGKTQLGNGVVGLIDNQIDQTTGTMRLKASFPNLENRLWPGDYVNARALLQTRRNVITIPLTAVQRGPDSIFSYVVKADNTVEVRKLELGEESGGIVVVEKGLQEGEQVTTTNQYRLQPGAHVQIVTPAANAAAAAAADKDAVAKDAERSKDATTKDTARSKEAAKKDAAGSKAQ